MKIQAILDRIYLLFTGLLTLLNTTILSLIVAFIAGYTKENAEETMFYFQIILLLYTFTIAAWYALPSVVKVLKERGKEG